MGSIKAYLGVARAPFLALPFTLAAAGAAAGAFDGAFSWCHTVLALVGLVAAHIAVNALNEASDFESGIDLETERTPFSGGSGTIPAEALTSRAARRFAVGALLVALAIGIYLVTRVGWWPLVPVIAIGGILIVAYTDVLARAGVGEIAAGLGLGGLPVIGVALAQGGGLGLAAVAASVPATLMTFNLLLLNEFPDEAADRKGGRKNLVILLGRRAAARVYVLAALLTPASILVGVFLRWLPLPALAGMLPSLLLVPPVRWGLGGLHEPVPVPALGANVVWNLATNVLLAGGLAAGVLLR